MRIFEDLAIRTILLSDNPDATTLDKSINDVFARRGGKRPVELIKFLLVPTNFYHAVVAESDAWGRRWLDSNGNERFDGEIVHRYNSYKVVFGGRFLSAFPSIICISSKSL